MVKVTAELKGFVKPLVESLLHEPGALAKTAAKDATRTTERDAAKAAGKDTAKAATKDVNVPFKLTDTTKKFSSEMRRQLDRQLEAFDGKTAGEALDMLKNPGERMGEAQKAAREQMTDVLKRRAASNIEQMSDEEFEHQLKAFGIASTGDVEADVENLAEAHAKTAMSQVHALHEPDLVAGGKDVIGKTSDGLDSFGLGNINSSIGSQWKNVKGDLINELGELDPSQPIRLTHSL